MDDTGDDAGPVESNLSTGYSACFHSVLRGVARQQKIKLGDGTSSGARVSIGDNGKGAFGLSVALEVVIPTLPHDDAQALADAATKYAGIPNASATISTSR